MRVIAGSKRRYTLKSPRGDKIRPTSDQIKETLFNIIGNSLVDAVFADLFSGTGQIGIEALSRGAKLCLFLDKDKDAIRLINENVEHVGFSDCSDIIQTPLPGGIKRIDGFGPDVIFMDPPYSAGLYKDCIREISGLKSLPEDVLIICEADKKEDFSFVSEFGFYIEKEKIYKSSKHVFVKKNE